MVSRRVAKIREALKIVGFNKRECKSYSYLHVGAHEIIDNSLASSVVIDDGILHKCLALIQLEFYIMFT